MKVYVEKLPNECQDCPCHNIENGHCNLEYRISGDGPRPEACPLKTLQTYRFELISKLLFKELGKEE